MICQPHVLRATPRPVPLRSHCATLRAQWNRALSSAYPSSQAFGLPRGEGFVFVQRFLDRLLCRTAWTPAHGEGGHCEPRAKQSRDRLAAPGLLRSSRSSQGRQRIFGGELEARRNSFIAWRHKSPSEMRTQGSSTAAGGAPKAASLTSYFRWVSRAMNGRLWRQNCARRYPQHNGG
jgi:hypothetical protein